MLAPLSRGWRAWPGLQARSAGSGFDLVLPHLAGSPVFFQITSI